MSDTKPKKTVEEKLKLLFQLQKVDSGIDEIRTLSGELPLQVQDLEDDIIGLETRQKNTVSEIETLTASVKEKEVQMKDSEVLIVKYEKQQMNVRNNREFDSLNKEIEYQKLEIELSQKRIREYKEKLEDSNTRLKDINELMAEKSQELDSKKYDLNNITVETSTEEKELIAKSKELSDEIEERLIKAYSRIRKNVKNGLAVVSLERSSCGGCFNKIPPQAQLDIATRKKVIVCEHCGRILVDSLIPEEI
jgi:predicted  nucleic acid-binding Zn-ribbon protein